jgi:hypothetical protein
MLVLLLLALRPANRGKAGGSEPAVISPAALAATL